MAVIYRQPATGSCPACGLALHLVPVRGFDLARCEKCHGVWVDEPTLVELWRWMGMPPDLYRLTPATPERSRPCPRCSQPMRFVLLVTVKLDQCQACGVWFDGQELEAALGYPPSASERDWLGMFVRELGPPRT